MGGCLRTGSEVNGEWGSTTPPPGPFRPQPGKTEPTLSCVGTGLDPGAFEGPRDVQEVPPSPNEFQPPPPSRRGS